MKISPLAQGTGVQATESNGSSVTPDAKARAIAVMTGQEPEVQSSGDAQVDRAQASIKRIKMKTNKSTNRDDSLVEEQTVEEVPQEQVTQSAIPNTNEPAQETEETRPLSPQFAALAKAKRALQVKEREIAQREEALKTAQPGGGEDFKAKLKANPLSVLQDAGVTYDQLTEAILNDQNKPIDANALRAQIKEELKKELGEEFTSRDAQAEQQVLADIKRNVLALTSQGEQYEAIREAKAQAQVVELIHRTWKTTGEVLDEATAAELVENQLIDEALPFAKLSKVQSRLTPAQERFVEKILNPPKANTKIMRTLTNRDSATPVMDKRQRAIMAMQGTLKKG